MKLQKIGMRTVKTGIAVSLCTLLAQYLVENPMFRRRRVCSISTRYGKRVFKVRI